MVLLLCLGAAGATFVYYDRATQPDRGTPVAVTQEFLTAFLVNRDDVRAAAFQCAGSSGLAGIRAFRDDIDARQKSYGVSIAVLVNGVYETTRTGGDATVAAGLVLTTTLQGKTQSASENWEFTAHDENGWRVCGGHEVT